MRPLILISGSAEVFRNYDLAVRAAGGMAVFANDSQLLPRCHGLLLPGGGDVEPWRYGQRNVACRNMDPNRDALEFQLLERFQTQQKPVLGICRGMQLLNVFFGGTLLQDISGHSQTANEIDRLHRVRTTHSFLISLYGERQVINSAHHQAVERLGNGLRAVQWSADGIVEAVEHEELPIWGVQWHPERMRGTMASSGAADGDSLFQAFVEQCRRKNM